MNETPLGFAYEDIQCTDSYASLAPQQYLLPNANSASRCITGARRHGSNGTVNQGNTRGGDGTVSRTNQVSLGAKTSLLDSNQVWVAPCTAGCQANLSYVVLQTAPAAQAFQTISARGGKPPVPVLTTSQAYYNTSVGFTDGANS
jgi:hypothetical protein